MSVGRDTIAKLNGVPEEEVRCDRCFRRDREGRVFDADGNLSKNVWCFFWDNDIEPDAFCSFFGKEET